MDQDGVWEDVRLEAATIKIHMFVCFFMAVLGASDH